MPASALCAGCHKEQDSPAFSASHSNVPVKGADCAGCHDPHMGSDKRLLYDVRHEPFEKGDCKKCHQQKR